MSRVAQANYEHLALDFEQTPSGTREACWHAWSLLEAAGLPGRTATAALLWPGPTERRAFPLPPCHARLRGYGSALRLDLSAWDLTPPTAPLVRLSRAGRDLQTVAMATEASGELDAAVARLRSLDEEPVWEALRARQNASIALATDDGRQPPIPLGPGLLLISGPSAGGKTTLLRTLAESEHVARVDWGEPVSEAAGSFAIPHLEQGVARALSDGFPVVVVDSVKNLLLSGENLGAGGLSQTFLKQLSTISAAAAAANITMVFTINLLSASGREDVKASILEAIRGSVTASLWIERKEGSASPVRMQVTTRAGSSRAQQSVTSPARLVIA